MTSMASLPSMPRRFLSCSPLAGSSSGTPSAAAFVKAFTASAAGSVNCMSVAVLSSSARGIRVFPARLPEAAATHAARSVARTITREPTQNFQELPYRVGGDEEAKRMPAGVLAVASLGRPAHRRFSAPPDAQELLQMGSFSTASDACCACGALQTVTVTPHPSVSRGVDYAPGNLFDLDTRTNPLAACG